MIHVQRDSDRRAWVAGAIGDHRVGHAYHLRPGSKMGVDLGVEETPPCNYLIYQ